uniref:Uncharacterized protein n=1 Tax=Plectus sambesii TaxID=2011161 RepID=A0A914WE00_9BILA
MRSAEGFHTCAVSSGVAGAYHRNPLYVTFVPNAYEMDRQQTYYVQQQQHQTYIPMGHSSMHQPYPPGPAAKTQRAQVYVPTTTQTVRYDGQQPVYYVTNDAPPAEEQECLALRQCW